MSRKVAVVTGSNKGIGYAVVKGLAKQFQGDVILTGYSCLNVFYTNGFFLI
jgi:NAD(P)-dependent dehydrogenase (short-subunit alcohol dehydrogenase family)